MAAARKDRQGFGVDMGRGMEKLQGQTPLREAAMAGNGEDREVTMAVQELVAKLDLHDLRTQGYATALKESAERQERTFENFREATTDMQQSISSMEASMTSMAKTLEKVARVVFWIAIAVGGKESLSFLGSVWPR